MNPPLVGRLRAAWAGSLLSDRSLATLLVGLMLTYIGLGLVVPVRALYAREVGLSLAGIGAMASSFLLFNTIGQAPFGWLADHLGRRPLILAGIGVEVVIALLYLAPTEPWLFILLRALEGVAAAAISPAARALVGDLAPPERRGEAYALLGAALNGGFLLGPAVGGWIVALADYQAAFVASAAGRGLALVLLAVALREPARQGVRATEGHPTATFALALGPVLLACYLLALGLGYANGLFFALWSIWLQDRGASTWLIGLTFTAFSLPSLLLAPLAGRLADRFGRLRLIVVPGLLDALIYLAYAATGDVLLILLLNVVQGTLYAFILPALDALIADHSPPGARGRVQGVYMATMQAGGFVSTIACTLLYGWHPVAPFVGITLVMGTGLLIGALVAGRALRAPQPGASLAAGSAPATPMAAPVPGASGDTNPADNAGTILPGRVSSPERGSVE
jgi:MFS family permease